VNAPGSALRRRAPAARLQSAAPLAVALLQFEPRQDFLFNPARKTGPQPHASKEAEGLLHPIDPVRRVEDERSQVFLREDTTASVHNGVEKRIGGKEA
jgi:hypothetical protein